MKNFNKKLQNNRNDAKHFATYARELFNIVNKNNISAAPINEKAKDIGIQKFKRIDRRSRESLESKQFEDSSNSSK